MTDSTTSDRNSPQQSTIWQITTLQKPQKFIGLGNFGTREIGTKIPVLTNQKGQILAIPGLIGGENSKSENNSLDLVLEVANFEGEMVAKSSFDLGYRSDASKIWAGSVSQYLPELFNEKMVEILDLWQNEIEKDENELETELEKKTENFNLTTQNLTNKIENLSKENKSQKLIQNENVQNSAKNAQYSNQKIDKLWQIQPILKWQKNNSNFENTEKNLEIKVKMKSEIKIKVENGTQMEIKLEIDQKLAQSEPKITQELQKEQNSRQNIKIDFEYLANGLDSQSVEFWKPQIIQKLNLIGKYDEETRLWQGNLLYGNTTTLQGLLCDLVRLIGFENLKNHHLTIENGNNFNQSAKKWEMLQKVKNLVQSFGFTEVITRPFISEKNTQLAYQNAHKVLNPYNSNLPYLRNSLLPTLLQIASQNLQKGWKNLNIFEINQIFTNQTEQIDQNLSQNSHQNSDQNPNIHSKIQSKNQIKMQLNFGIISLEDPYLLTTLAHKMAERLGFDVFNSMNFEKAENNLGQITTLTWTKETQKETNSLGTGLEMDLETNLKNSSKLKTLDEKSDEKNVENSQNSGQNTKQNKLRENLVFRIIQLKNSLKKEFDLSLDKPIWYMEVEIGDWKLRALDKYFDELDFPSISRDYSLSVTQTGGKNWQEINQIISEIPSDFVVKTWPKEYFVNQIKNENKDKLQNDISDQIEKSEINKETKTETKISFKVKFQSQTETLKSEQIDNWEKEMMTKLTQK